MTHRAFAHALSTAQLPVQWRDVPYGQGRRSYKLLANLATVLAVLVVAWTFALPTVANAEPTMRAVMDPVTGGVDLFEDDRPVLRYNYRAVEPPDGVLEKVPANSRKYARPRSNYIHPLYGPDGEVLTEDWSVDHPHHRGIYWAWPEVDFNGARGDLHALQHVFARPTGAIELTSSETSAQIEAENLWRWDDKTPIVRELTTITRASQHRAWPVRRFEVSIHGS